MTPIEGFLPVRVTGTTWPWAVYIPSGPPQKAIVGVTRGWSCGKMEIRAQSAPRPASWETAKVPKSSRTGLRFPTTPIAVARSPGFPQCPAVLIWYAPDVP